MKAHHAAGMILILLTVFVIVNATVIVRITDGYIGELDAIVIPDDPKALEGRFSDMYERYMKHESYISLTANHEDLTNIENSFSELIGAAAASDREACMQVKSRLTDAFRHLGRLSSFNFYSIF